MFYLILAINALTDLKEGAVYDVLSLLLFVSAAAETGFDFGAPYFWGCLTVLGVVFILDRAEEWLGRGDYLILLAVSLYTGARLPLVMLLTSGTGLAFLAVKKERSIPLVPFLFMGTVLAGLPVWQR